jgi:hypothetical protein
MEKNKRKTSTAIDFSDRREILMARVEKAHKELQEYFNKTENRSNI